MVAAVLSSSCECSFATQFQTRDPCHVTGISAYRIQAVYTHSRQQHKQACVLRVRYLLEKPLLRSLQTQMELFSCDKCIFLWVPLASKPAVL